MNSIESLMNIKEVVAFGYKEPKSIYVYVDTKKLSPFSQAEIKNICDHFNLEFEIVYHGKITPL
jgi:hypothetical protein